MTFNLLNDSKSSFFELIKNGSEPLKSQVKSNEAIGIKYINLSNEKQSEYEKELFDQQINNSLEQDDLVERDKEIIVEKSIDEKNNTQLVENDFFANYINEKYKSLKLRTTTTTTTNLRPFETVPLNNTEKLEKIDQIFATSIDKLNKNNCGVIISDIKSNVVLDFINDNKLSQNNNKSLPKGVVNSAPDTENSNKNLGKKGLFEGYLDPNIKNVNDPIPDFKGLVNKTASEHYDLAIDTLLCMFFPVNKMTSEEQNFLFITNNLVGYIFKSCIGLEKYYSNQKRQNVIKVLSLIINEKCLDLLKLKYNIKSNDEIISFMLKSNDYKMFFLYLIVFTETIEFFFFNIFNSNEPKCNNSFKNQNSNQIKDELNLNTNNESKRKFDGLNFDEINIENVYELTKEGEEKTKKQLKLSPRRVIYSLE